MELKARARRLAVSQTLIRPTVTLQPVEELIVNQKQLFAIKPTYRAF